MNTSRDAVTYAYQVTELTFVSRHEPSDGSQVFLSCEVTGPDGRNRTIPAFWVGGPIWKVRFSSGLAGLHQYKTACSDEEHGEDLDGIQGVIQVLDYCGDNPLYKHGPIRLADDGRHLSYADGTPFFWLADSWWFGAQARFRWPDVFMTLTADRVKKGFNVVAMVVGLAPEMEPDDIRMASEGGMPWDGDFDRLNPDYFNAVDRKIDWLVESGITPMITASWGYYLNLVGADALKLHWRELVARYSAYPVVWCVAGEVSLPSYDDARPQLGEVDEVLSVADLVQSQHDRWSEIARYIRNLDPYRRPMTVHPCELWTYTSSEAFTDPSLYDIDLMQTGHGDRHCFDSTLRHLIAAIDRGRKPVINGEVCYEGIFGSNWQDTQRFLFWTHVLSGAAGHTYGTFAISNFSSRDDRYTGISRCSDDVWEEFYQLPGSAQMGVGKDLLERFEWHKFEPHPEWVKPHWTEADRILPYAAGVDDDIRLFYFPSVAFLNPHGARGDISMALRQIQLTHLQPATGYRAQYHNPRNGEDLPEFEVVSSDEGTFLLGRGDLLHANPTGEDWVLSLRRPA